jgi:hypothetical protein
MEVISFVQMMYNIYNDTQSVELVLQPTNKDLKIGRSTAHD